MRVFVSYAPDDKELKNQLLKYLGPAIRAGVLAPWDASQVRAGDDKSPIVESALERADVALVLLSAGYLAMGGPADRDLVRIAARRTGSGLRVVPILLSPCDWQSEARIKDLQVLPRDGRPLRSRRDRDEALVEVCRELVGLALPGTGSAEGGKPANTRVVVLTRAVAGWALVSLALLLIGLFGLRSLRCLVQPEQCGSAKPRGDGAPAGEKLNGAALVPTPVAAAPAAAPGATPSTPAAVDSGAAAVEVNSDNVIEDSPGGEMPNHAVLPRLQPSFRLNSGNRMTGSKGAKMDNRIQVTP